MEQTLIYGLFETLMVLVAGLRVLANSRYPEHKILKIGFKLKINQNFLLKFLKIDCLYHLPADRLSTDN